MPTDWVIQVRGNIALRRDMHTDSRPPRSPSQGLIHEGARPGIECTAGVRFVHGWNGIPQDPAHRPVHPNCKCLPAQILL